MAFARRLAPLALLALLVIAAHARADAERTAFCAQTAEAFQDQALERRNRMSFQNSGGLASGGVCWWHSRFQRAALYLTVMRPELPRPSLDQAKQIVHSIKNMSGVVEVPGYRDFYSFSHEWKSLIQSQLAAWQREDGILGQRWVVGLLGRTSTSAKSLEREMDRLYQEVERDQRIAYQKLQMPGIVVHAWLVISMRPTGAGYILSVIDSNSPGETHEYEYTRGMKHFVYRSDHPVPFVPYRERGNTDYLKIVRAVERYCLN